MDNADIKAYIKGEVLRLGAAAVGVACAGAVSADEWARFESWLATGRAGALEYMARYADVRSDPRRLLIDKNGAPVGRTVVSMAWPYLPAVKREAQLPYIAYYAYCEDYHRVVRRLLKPVLAQLRRRWEVKGRICVDSAPILERYWAVQAGVGFIGRNRCLIVPGAGSWVFLSELVIDAELEPDAPCERRCAGCTACWRACPARALGPDGVDARRCLSALTAETPGGAPGSGHLLGCDECQLRCPHNACTPASGVAAFAPLPAVLRLDAAELAALDDAAFRARYGGTPLARPGLAGLRANLGLPGTPPH